MPARMIFVFFSLLCTILENANCAFAGPYTLIMRSVNPCPENEVALDSWRPYDLHGVMYHNKSVPGYSVFSGNFSIRDNIGQRRTTAVRVTSAKWDPVSGWRPNYLSAAFDDLCFPVETVLVDLMQILHKYIDSFPLKCPLGNGQYVFNNVPSKIGALKRFPQMPYGRYRSDVFGYRRGRVRTDLPFACYRAEIDILEKSKAS